MNEKSILRLANFFDQEEIVDISVNIDLILLHAYENMEIGFYQEAARLFYIFIEERRQSTEALNGLAVCFFEMQQYDRAQTIVDHALTLFPDDSVSLSNKASLEWQEERYDEAVYYYQKSLLVDPAMVESKVNLVNLYRETGDLLLAYTLCLELQASHPGDSEIHDLLNSLLIDMAIFMS
ncbi:MAG: tetratricopeptide repeat protein [Spirochaetes bacterium]|jgi:tetratricopeptide (TPR) repeat protein|nr:tetratricopeptide repeat protein [Spirochaetota bacterium]